jgi:hypothetical protein
MPSPSLATRSPPDELPQPVRLTDEQMSAILAASHPIAPARRSAFLADVARELAALREIGDGALHRVIMAAQKRYFDPSGSGHATPKEEVRFWFSHGLDP